MADNYWTRQKQKAQTGEPTPAEVALGKDLAPLFAKYLRGESTRDEWTAQLQYFADRHDLGWEMRSAINQQLAGGQ